MTRQAAEAAGSGEMSKLPILRQHETQDNVGLLLITADRGLAGAFNAQILRAGTAAGRDFERDGASALYYATGRRGTSSLTFRGLEPKGSWVGFTERPAYANAREVAEALMVAYIDGDIDRVEMFYNGYVSPLTQELRRETLLPLQDATILEGGEHDVDKGDDHDSDDDEGKHALVEYEPGPDEILKRLVPDYVEISIYRALLESAASELGARMTAMRNASENAAEVIEDLTLEMNRARQAEITQEIMEVVAGAEALS
jgi:F-type H+-transporting ATPase subunit gamma